MMWEERREKKRETETERERERERKAERGKRETPNTCALAQTTLKITIGCSCRGPSRRFQGACRFSAHKKLPSGEIRKNACMWAGPSQAVLEMAASDAHARQGSVKAPSGARFFSADASDDDATEEEWLKDQIQEIPEIDHAEAAMIDEPVVRPN